MESSSSLIPTLMLFTLIAVLGIAVWQLLAFLRKRKNRELASRAFSGSDADRK